MAGKKGTSGGARKNAGRKAGGHNRATIEKAIIAERVMNEAAMSGRKLGKEVVEEFMVLFSGLAGSYQPQPSVPGQPVTAEDMKRWDTSGNAEKFDRYADRAVSAAIALAKYQSPTFKSIELAAPAPQGGSTIEGQGVQRTKFTLHIFGDDPRNKVIEHEPAKKRA